jgi:hypothetical protein
MHLQSPGTYLSLHNWITTTRTTCLLLAQYDGVKLRYIGKCGLLDFSDIASKFTRTIFALLYPNSPIEEK